MEGWLRLSRPGSALRWFTSPKMVTHPSTNWAWYRVTRLIETNMLPLSQTGNMKNMKVINERQAD